ncbi:hypothetical protein SAMN05216349_1722, partial [Oribacterium sp. KHPX15]
GFIKVTLFPANDAENISKHYYFSLDITPLDYEVSHLFNVIKNAEKTCKNSLSTYWS